MASRTAALVTARRARSDITVKAGQSPINETCAVTLAASPLMRLVDIHGGDRQGDRGAPPGG